MKIARFQPKIPIIQIATKFTIFKITLRNFSSKTPYYCLFQKYNFCVGGKARFQGGKGGKVESKLENCHFSRDIRGNCSNFCTEKI